MAFQAAVHNGFKLSRQQVLAAYVSLHTFVVFSWATMIYQSRLWPDPICNEVLQMIAMELPCGLITCRGGPSNIAQRNCQTFFFHI